MCFPAFHSPWIYLLNIGEKETIWESEQSPTVATSPSVGAWRGTWWCIFQGRKNMRSRHQHLFEENVGKTKMERVKGLRILKMRVWELFMHGEGISTPRTRRIGRQPLIECANHDFNIIYFPFYLYSSFLYIFFTVLGSTRLFLSLLRILGCDEEVRPT